MSDFASFQQQYPESYTNLLTKINHSQDESHNTYFHTIVAKQNTWFGAKMVHLILQQPQHLGLYELFYEKMLNVDFHLNYQPGGEIVKKLELKRVKMVARNQNKLTVAYISDKKNICQYVFEFSSNELASEWEQLIMKKRLQAKQVSINCEDKDALIRKMVDSIEKLQKQLSQLKGEWTRLLELNAVVKQENMEYRVLVHTLENQIIVQKSQHLTQNTNRIASTRRTSLENDRKDDQEQYLKRIDMIVEQMRAELAKQDEKIQKRDLQRMAKQIKRQLNIYKLKSSSMFTESRSRSNPKPTTTQNT